MGAGPEFLTVTVLGFVLTGGILSVEFINSYFFENLGTRPTACAASCARALESVLQSSR